MAAQSAEAQQAALDSGLPDVLVKCLQQAINGVAPEQAPKTYLAMLLAGPHWDSNNVRLNSMLMLQPIQHCVLGLSV